MAKTRKYEQDTEGNVATLAAPDEATAEPAAEQQETPTAAAAETRLPADDDVHAGFLELSAITGSSSSSPISLSFEGTIFGQSAATIRAGIEAEVTAAIDRQVEQAREVYAISSEAATWTQHLRRKKELTRDLTIAEAEYEHSVAAVRVATVKGEDPNELVRQRDALPGKIEGLRVWLTELEPVLRQAERAARSLWRDLVEQAHTRVVQPALALQRRASAEIVRLLLPYVRGQLIDQLTIESSAVEVQARHSTPPMDADLLDVA